MNYQKLVIVGNVTADAQKLVSKNGTPYTTFGVAVSVVKEHPVFFPIVAFDKLGEIAAQYVVKGREVLVEGRIQDSKNLGVTAEKIVLGAVAKATGDTQETK